MSIAGTLAWMLATIVKFLLTPSIMISAGKGFLYTWAVTSAGAAVGFILFYYLGSAIFKYMGERRKVKKPPTKSTIKRLRFILKNGLPGLLLVAPLVSVPLSAILASRFFNTNKFVIPIFIVGFTIWSLILTSISYGVRMSL